MLVLELFPGDLGNGEHGRMFDFAFYRQCVKSLGDTRDCRDGVDAVHGLNFLADNGSHWKNADASFAHNLHHGAIFEFASYLRPDLIFIKPDIQRTAKDRILHGQQDGC